MADFPPKPSFTPLVSNDQRVRIFGRFKYKADPERGNPEHIEITDGWDEENIEFVPLPQMAKLDLGRGMQFHRKGVTQLQGLWKAWDDAGLLDRVKEFDGSYAPRFVRGSRSTLSNHAWGCAFDINYNGNEMGMEPAAVGHTGSVRELVPIANAWGFYWGGHYDHRKDGMHFELTKLGMDGTGEIVEAPDPAPTYLKIGSRGLAVRQFQQLFGLPITGIFGEAEDKAVREFQRAHGLTIDGVVGPQTRKEFEFTTPGWHWNVLASVFGGSSEIERSAYDRHRIGNSEKVVALPMRFEGTRPTVEVSNRATGKKDTATIEDVGPWNEHDQYPLKWDARPQAESGRDAQGRKTNRAGIDLSPALARSIGINGMGRVDWRLIT